MHLLMFKYLNATGVLVIGEKAESGAWISGKVKNYWVIKA